MHVIATHSRNARAAGGVRLRAPRLAARRTPRRTALTIVLALLVLLLLAAEAQAYVPGQLIWAKRIGTSTSEAGAWAVAAGPNGATAIAGWKMVPQAGPPPMVQVPMVARYSAGGSRWLMTYTAPGYAQDVAIDRSGNVYVAATINPSSGGDIVVLKYNAAGVFKWATTPYDGGVDSAREIAVDGAGNVVVAGSSNPGAKMGIVVLKYAAANGTMMWAGPGGFFPSLSDPDSGNCYLNDLALGATGDIYVAGSSEHRVGGVWIERARLIKFAGADGFWANGSTYEPKNAPSGTFESIAVRGSAVVAVGSIWDSAGDHREHALVTKSDLNLAPKTFREWGVGDATEEWFNDVVLDGKGNVYITGDQWLDGTRGYDKAVTMKLSPGLGKILWKAAYLPTSRDAEGWFIARDSLGNVYVSGVKETKLIEDFLTIKYSPTGVRKWLKTWSGGGPDDDDPNGMVLGTKGGVYVGGQVTGKGDNYQAALLKYQR
jgi:hypothetical protein